MNSFIFSALLACVPHAGAQGAAKPPAQPAVQPPDSARHYPEILQTMKNLSVLMERGAEIPAEKMDALAAELPAFNLKVKEAIGEKILAEIAAREKTIEEKARAEAGLKTLQAFRASLQVYYTENGGRYPKTPAELVGKSITNVPELHLPGHQLTGKITLIDSKKYDKDSSKAVTDSGGWLYFTNPGSANYGLLLLDCSHLSPEGAAFSNY